MVQLAELGEGTKEHVAEWPFKAGIIPTRGPSAKTAGAQQPGGMAVKG